MNVIGVDIGGANIKVSDAFGKCRAVSFPMWTQHHMLGDSLKHLLESFPSMTELAVTMTGELADCFATRREGVCKILDQVEMVADANRTWVYAVGDLWLSPSQARQDPWSVAASNWFALATWIGRCIGPNPRDSGNWIQPTLNLDHVDLVIDAGSTTVDIIPMSRGEHGMFAPDTPAKTDRQRMQRGQLVYTGMQRTPVAAIVSELNVNGDRCPAMAERFATSDDCYLAVDATPESPENRETADGQPRTRQCALARIARMVGEDSETLSESVIIDLAQQIILAQATQVADAIVQNLPTDRIDFNVVIAGHGRPLIASALGILANRSNGKPLSFNLRWLDEILSPDVARSAPATAVAVLRSWA